MKSAPIEVFIADAPTAPAVIIADSRQQPDTIEAAVARYCLAGYRVRRYREARGPAVARHASETVVQTPPIFLDAVEGRFGPLDFDIAASPGMSVVQGHRGEEMAWTPADNALAQDWTPLVGNAWLNPPFDPAEPWVKRAAETKIVWDLERAQPFSSPPSRRILVLLPFAPGARWWRRWVHGVADVLSVGRMTFVGQVQPFPKDLALLVYYAGSGNEPLEYWDWPGRLRGRKKAKVAT